MPKINEFSRRPVVGVMAILTLASLGLTACGGSSGSTSSRANAAATSATGASTSTAGSTTTTGTPTTGTSTGGTSTSGPSQQHNGTQRAGLGRFAAMRACLRRNGVTLPRPTSGPGGTIRGFQLPKGVTTAQYQAALRKCGGFLGAGPGARATANPVFRQALVKYATCLRQNGVNIPAPNTSGKGPIFGPKGLNPSSPRFRAAAMKCRSVLATAFRRPQGGGTTTGAGR